MAQTFHRNRFTWLIYLLFAFFAFNLNGLGPITPFLKDDLQLSYTVSSLHFTAFATGLLLIGLGGHRLVRWTGRWQSLWIGAGGLSFGVLILLSGHTAVITIGAALLMGLTGALILTIAPAVLSDQHGELRAIALIEVNLTGSLAAAAAPLLVGWFAQITGSWRLALASIALAPPLLYLALGKNADWVTISSDKTTGEPTDKPLPLLYWIYWVALMMGVSIEFCMIFWSADYLEQVVGMARANAAQSVSLILAGMIVGRLSGSRLVNRFSAYAMVTVSILITGVGFLIFWTIGTVFAGLSGLFITGLGIANLYPLILSLALGAVSAHAVQASARATLASGTAILTLPLVLGRLADAMGIHLAYGVILVLVIGIFLIIQVAKRISESSQQRGTHAPTRTV